MSEQIREQGSAFLDGELPNSETELLLKRLTRDGELREIKSPIILQPGPAALTDGLDAIHRVMRQWSTHH